MSKTPTTGSSDKPMRPMTDDEVMAAALSDPDAQPLTAAQLARMKHTPRAKIIRRAFGLTRRSLPRSFRSRSGH